MQTSTQSIVGIDEAGRGPLAGPVVAAALVLKDPKKVLLKGNFDSKKLSEQRREELYRILEKHPAVAWGIGKVSPLQIDRMNIYQATKRAMELAVKNLEKKDIKVKKLIIDGTMKLALPYKQKAIPHADSTIPLCMLASIVAKVTRDRLMRRNHKLYPQYGFDRHKGYGTSFHQKMLKRYGPCKIHRISFQPCRNSSYMIR